MKKVFFRKYMLLFLISLIIFAGFALGIGKYPIPFSEIIHIFLSKITGADTNEKLANILFHIRIPRIFGAMMIGAMLALSGAVYQGIFKNPLVSPDLLGVSSGASVGAAIAIILGYSFVSIQILAFLGGILAVFIAVLLPRFFRNHSNMMLVLSGIIVGGFFSSLLSISKFVADEETDLAAIVFWQMGSIAKVKMPDVWMISPVFFLASFLLILLAWKINVISFGEKEAHTLGIHVKSIRTVVIICATLLTASAVSISGTIGWIGLIIPHFTRLLVGADHQKLLPLTMVFGALFMLVIDTIARAALSLEIPLSILTGFVGAPCFAWLLYKQKTTVQ